METTKPLVKRLQDEKLHRISGGIYNKLQVDLAYNSSHMEGNRLAQDQVHCIYEAHILYSDKPVRVDDITETINHFRCFDYVLDHYDEPLSEDLIRHLHYLLKNNTFSAQSEEAVVGDYKKLPNYVGNIVTSEPEEVHHNMSALIRKYNAKKKSDLDDILGLHADFEHIHPFYDGNGRVGRLVMFKECLKNDIIPFIITDEYKFYYLRGLHEWQTGGEKGYLRDTCLLMQDNMKQVLKYFRISFDNNMEDKEKK